MTGRLGGVKVYRRIALVRPLHNSGIGISELCLKVRVPGVLESLTGRSRKQVAAIPRIWYSSTISLTASLSTTTFHFS